MKIKRYQAKDMRTAIRMVQDDQGPDAVILSNRRTESGGVEIVAAVDYDEALMRQASKHHEVTERSAAERKPARAVAAPATRREPDAPAPKAAVRAGPSEPSVAEIVASIAPPPAAAGSDLEQQLTEMRQLLEVRLGRLESRSWRLTDTAQRKAYDILYQIGVDEGMARELAEAVPAGSDVQKAMRAALLAFARRIPVQRDDVIDGGGVLALVGPTGVGKTTTVAKIAARYAMRNPGAPIQLLSTDDFRIGGQEQLQTYGRLLNVPVRSVGSRAEMADILDSRESDELILIDTAGVGPRDDRLTAQFDRLSVSRDVRVALCLSASAHPADLAACYRRFAPARPQMLMLTKVDESSQLGAALTLAIRSRRPVAYLADGQRVPEDLHHCRADELVRRAHAARPRLVKQESARACA